MAIGGSGALCASVFFALALACGPMARAHASQGVDISGQWHGKLQAPGGELRLLFHITKDAAGAYGGTIDSLDQGASGLPLKTVTVAEGQVRIVMAAPVASFDGKLSEDGARIDGTFEQNGFKMKLSLARGGADPPPAPPRRPREPKPPYPYREEQVSYTNPDGAIKLAATLTIPKGKGPFPAAVLITGSGAQNRNEELMGHKPFLVLADYLARRGIAVLRADDRGVGGSSGSTAMSTTADFAGDALAGVAYLRGRKEIAPRKIGLIGHSEGGCVAPIAAGKSKDVAYVVLLAGTGVPGWKVILSQGALISKASGAPQAAIDSNQAVSTRLFEIMNAEKDDAAAEKQMMATLREAFDKLPEAQRAAAGDPDVALGQQVKVLMNPWMRYFVSYDPAPALRGVKCPVLAINGEKDMQVIPSLNLPAIRAALNAGGNKDHTVLELPGLNHLFQTAKVGTPAEYGQIEETMSPKALAVVGDWIAKRTGAR